MARRIRFLTLAVVVATLAACTSSKLAAPEDADAATLYAHAQKLVDMGEIEAALETYETVFEDFPTAPEARDAEWRAAELTLQLEKPIKARALFKQYHESHRLDHLGPLEDYIYEIGVDLYEDGQSGLLGLGILPTSAEGLNTLTWLTENLGNGSRADDALFFLGKAHLRDGMPDEAILFFEELLRPTGYPESEWALESRFLKATAHFMLNRGPAYDLASLLLAKKEFLRYIADVERDPVRKQEYKERLLEAHAEVGRINGRIARKNLLIAKFYVSQEREEAAKIYLTQAVTGDYGRTKAGAAAQIMLEKLGE